MSDLPPPRRFVLGALRAFARSGYAGTSMDDIAGEVGVSQPRISQVFDGKLGAFLAAHQVALEAFTAEITSARPQSPSSFDPDAVHEVVERLLVDSPHVPMFLLRSLVPAAHELRLVDLAGETIDQVTGVLRTQLGATDVEARAAFADIALTLVEAAAHRG